MILRNISKPRIQLLLFVVCGVIAVLADQQDSVYREFVATQGQRVNGRTENRYVILLGALAADVLLRNLFRKHGHDFRARVWRLVVLIVAFEVFADHDVGVRARADIR